MISISYATFFFSFQNILAKNFFNLNKIQIGFSRNVNTWCLLNSVFSNIVLIFYLLKIVTENLAEMIKTFDVLCSNFRELFHLTFLQLGSVLALFSSPNSTAIFGGNFIHQWFTDNWRRSHKFKLRINKIQIFGAKMKQSFIIFLPLLD